MQFESKVILCYSNVQKIFAHCGMAKNKCHNPPFLSDMEASAIRGCHAKEREENCIRNISLERVIIFSGSVLETTNDVFVVRRNFSVTIEAVLK